MANLLYPHKKYSEYITLYNESKKKNKSLRDCPLYSPYFSSQSLSCIKCPDNAPLFNLETGTCSSCAHPTVYNPSNYRCENILAHRMSAIDQLFDH